MAVTVALSSMARDTDVIVRVSDVYPDGRSILIVDYAILGEAAGMNRHDALIDACRKRARPVIMTTLAMGAGMLPLALGLNVAGVVP